MKNKISLTISIVFACILFSSCKKDNRTASIREEEKPKALLQAAYDNTVRTVASKTAKFLQDQKFREFLKAEALKTFDGDYDVLLSTVAKYLDEKKLNSADPTDISYIQEIAKKHPQMQLSVQVKPGAWDVNSYIPPVVYCTFGFNGSVCRTVPVVNAEGKIVSTLDATKEPSKPVVIVSHNERTYITPEGKVALNNEGFTTRVVSMRNNNVLSEELPPVVPMDPVWYRANYKYESLFAFKFTRLNEVEPWVLGGPEVNIVVYRAEDPQGLNYNKEGWIIGERRAPRDKVENRWFTFAPIQCHLWRWSQSGTTFKYVFYEQDPIPFDAEIIERVGDLVIPFASETTGKLIGPALKLAGLILKKNSTEAKTLGEIEISANNNRVEFQLATGGFQFKSKPF